MNLLSKTDFYAWGSDDLKLDVASGKLDIALVYSGDFFDAYYSDLEAEGDESANVETYGIYAPKYHNNVFFDALVIPKTSSNIDGAALTKSFTCEISAGTNKYIINANTPSINKYTSIHPINLGIFLFCNQVTIGSKNQAIINPINIGEITLINSPI
jgi:spermidine/putrescine-binding protein